MTSYIPRPVRRDTPKRQDSLLPAGFEAHSRPRAAMSSFRVEPTLKEPLNSAPRGATPQGGAREGPAASSPRSSMYNHRTRKSGPELERSGEAGDRTERRSERERISIIDRVTIRTKSPVKDPDYVSTVKRRSRDTPGTNLQDLMLVRSSPMRSSESEGWHFPLPSGQIGL